MPMLKLQSELFECQNFVWNFWTSFRVYLVKYSLSFERTYTNKCFVIIDQSWHLQVAFIGNVNNSNERKEFVVELNRVILHKLSFSSSFHS